MSKSTAKKYDKPFAKSHIEHILRHQKVAFKYAVFSGGGAKGAIYSGVQEALASSAILDGLEGIAGSSAGAITAAIIATGISVEDCKTLSKNTNFSTLLGKGFFQKDGKPIYQLLRDTIAHNITEYTKNLDIQSVCASRISEITKLRTNILEGKMHPDYSDEERQIVTKKLYADLRNLEKIQENDGAALKDLDARIQSGDVVYFKDLALLRLLNPSKFKDLIVTATNQKTGELTIFSAETSPNVEIALACRASAAIPRVLSPTKINGVDYVDGGYRDNIPLKYFTAKGIEKTMATATEVSKSGAIKETQGRILALAFGGDDISDSANIAVYTAQQRVLSYGVVLGFIIDIVCKLFAGVGGKQRFTKSEIETYEELRKNALNTIILDTGEVHTLSFATAQEQSAYLHIKGKIQTTEYLRNHDIVDHNLDRNFEYKNFMLTVYEQILAKTPHSKRHNEILQTMLTFCDSEKWPAGRLPTDVITEYIQTAATNLHDHYRLSTDTEEMKILVKTLNDKRVPDSVRQGFIDVLEINIGPIAQKHLVQFHFKLEDFEELLTKHHHSTTKPQKMHDRDEVRDSLSKRHSDFEPAHHNTSSHHRAPRVVAHKSDLTVGHFDPNTLEVIRKAAQYTSSLDNDTIAAPGKKASHNPEHNIDSRTIAAARKAVQKSANHVDHRSTDDKKPLQTSSTKHPRWIG